MTINKKRYLPTQEHLATKEKPKTEHTTKWLDFIGNKFLLPFA